MEQLNVFSALVYLDGAGHVRVPYGAFGDARMSSGTYTDNQGASLLLFALGPSSSNDSLGVICNASGDVHSGTDTRDMYRGYLSTTATITSHLEKVVNGSVQSLGTDTSTSWAASNRIEIEREDIGGGVVQVRLMKDGVTVISYNDSTSPLSGGRPGVTGASGATLSLGDDLQTFNITAGSTQDLAGGATGQGQAAANASVGHSLGGAATGQGQAGGGAGVGHSLGGAAAGQGQASGSMLAGATIYTLVFKNDSGGVLANTTIEKLTALRLSDLQQICTWNNVTSSGSGEFALYHADLVADQQYMLVSCNADGTAFGVDKYMAL